VVDEQVVGITHYHFHRSTWAPHYYCYLEDLFADETARNRGVGRALIEAVAERARSVGATRLYWNTHRDNAAAQALYNKLATQSEFVQYRRAPP